VEIARRAQKNLEESEAKRLRALKDADEAEAAKRTIEDAEASRLETLKAVSGAESARQVVEDTDIAKTKAIEDTAEVQVASLAQQETDETDSEDCEGCTEAATKQRVLEADRSSKARHEIGGRFSPSRSVSAFVMGATLSVAGMSNRASLVKLPLINGDEDESRPRISRFSPFDGNNSEGLETVGIPSVETHDPKVVEERVAPQDTSLNYPSNLEESTVNPTNSSLEPLVSPALESPKIPRFGRTFVDILCRSSSNLSWKERPSSSGSSDRGRSAEPKYLTPSEDLSSSPVAQSPRTPTRSLATSEGPELDAEVNVHKLNGESWIVAESPRGDKYRDYPVLGLQMSDCDSSKESNVARSPSKRHNRNISVLSRYLTENPTPEIYAAEPAEYFCPILSPVKSSNSALLEGEPISLSKSLLILSPPKELADRRSTAEAPAREPSLSHRSLNLSQSQDDADELLTSANSATPKLWRLKVVMELVRYVIRLQKRWTTVLSSHLFLPQKPHQYKSIVISDEFRHLVAEAVPQIRRPSSLIMLKSFPLLLQRPRSLKVAYLRSMNHLHYMGVLDFELRDRMSTVHQTLLLQYRRCLDAVH
jgi:hypothetical protein